MPSKASPKVSLKIRRKPSTGEWVVKVYFDGVYQEDPTYYTDDRQDAIDTAREMAKRYGIPVTNGIADWFGIKTKTKTPPYVTLLIKLVKQYDKKATVSVSPEFDYLTIVWNGQSVEQVVEIEFSSRSTIELIATIEGIVYTVGGSNPTKVITEFFNRILI